MNAHGIEAGLCSCGGRDLVSRPHPLRPWSPIYRTAIYGLTMHVSALPGHIHFKFFKIQMWTFYEKWMNSGKPRWGWLLLRQTTHFFLFMGVCETVWHFQPHRLAKCGTGLKALCELKQRWVVVGIISQVRNKLTCGHRRIVRGEVANCDWGKSDGLWNGFMLEYFTVWIMVD